MPRLLLALPVVVLAVLVVAPNAHASAPAGVWARVDKVTLDPNPKDPNLVRVDGTFMVAHTLPDSPDYPGYSVPSAGYMYYDCNDKQQAICVMEWQELAAVAGTDDRCRGWGDSSLPDNGSVRPAMQPAQKPDIYPIAQGIVKGFTPCEVLKAWEVENGTTTGGESETSTSTTDTGTSTTDTSTTGRPDPGTTGAPDPGGTADSGDVTGEATTVTGSDSAAESKGETGDIVGESSGSGGASSGGPGGSGGSGGGSSSSDTAASGDDDKACACRSDADPGGQALGVLASLLGLGLLRRRPRPT